VVTVHFQDHLERFSDKGLIIHDQDVALFAIACVHKSPEKQVSIQPKPLKGEIPANHGTFDFSAGTRIPQIEGS
jgi:hypothetical protein